MEDDGDNDSDSAIGDADRERAWLEEDAKSLNISQCKIFEPIHDPYEPSIPLKQNVIATELHENLNDK